MAAHALHFPPAAPHLKLVVSRPAAVWPAAPVLVVGEPAMSATMKRCLLLAVLLHVWLVLMLGSAPGGTAAPGQGVAGSLNITLQGPETPGAREVSAPPPPELAPPEGARGSATLPRWGGLVRDQAAAVPPTPGAAQLGRWSATAQPADAAVPAEAPPPPPGRVVEEQAQPAPTAVLQPMPPQRLPAALPELTTEATAAAVPLVAVPAAPQPERHLASPAARTLRDVGAALPLAPSAPAAPAALPSVAPLPVPETITPRLQRAVRPAAADLPALAPAPAPAPVPAPVPVPAAPLLQPAPLAPAPLAAVPEAMPAPTVMQAPTQAPTQTPTQAATQTPMPPALQPMASSPQPASIPSASPNVATPGLPPAAPAPAAPAPAALARGAPDAGSRLGADVATPPSAAASVPPRLNLQLSRPRGGELSRGSAGGMLPVLPRPPEVDEKLGRDIAKSARQDCRDAYRAAGLLAVVPLAAQALKADGGCKW